MTKVPEHSMAQQGWQERCSPRGEGFLRKGGGPELRSGPGSQKGGASSAVEPVEGSVRGRGFAWSQDRAQVLRMGRQVVDTRWHISVPL